MMSTHLAEPILLVDDEGDGTSAHDGGHDHILGSSGTNRNEAGYAVYNMGLVSTLEDLSWNGTDWAFDLDGGNDFRAARHFFNETIRVHTHEFAIPLNGSASDDAGSSDLDIDIHDELGFLLRVRKMAAGGGSFCWRKTNGDSANAAGWADLKLNVDRDFFVFYSSFAANGIPTIDGSLTDDAWRGAYRRDITLTNFEESVLDATLYSIQDPTNDIVYVALRIDDAVSNPGDYIQIYYEEDAGNTTALARNYVLEDNAEDALRVSGATSTDMFWDNTDWGSAGDDADAHGGTGQHVPGSHYVYEFVVPYSAGAFDIDLPDKGRPGFFIRYHDADAGSGEQEFYWDYGANADFIRIDPNSDAYMALGWPAFQMGAPYMQVIFPEDGQAVEGIANTRVYSVNQGPTAIDSAFFFRKDNGRATAAALTRVGTTHEWSGTWDVSNLSNGADTLVFQVYDGTILAERLVNVSISNGSGAVTPPTISDIQPVAGSTISGVQTISWTATANDGSIWTREISIDGADYDTIAGGVDSCSINTRTMLDGSHTVQVRIRNTAGGVATSKVITYIVQNAPSVSLDAPAGGTTVSGMSAIAYSASAVAPATIAAESLYVDGAAYQALTGTNDSLNTTLLLDGEHSLQVKVADNNGRTAMSEAIIVAVRNAPSITLDTPRADSVVTGTVELRFTPAVVAPATLVSVELAVDGGAWTATDSDSAHTWNTLNLADGSHVLKMKVMDNTGKIGDSDERLFVVDNTPPLAADPVIMYPDGGGWARSGQLVGVSVLVNDAIAGLALDSAVVLTTESLQSADPTYVLHDDGIDGDAVAGDHMFSASLVVDSDSSGTIDYTLVATDRLGNSVTLTSVITLDNTPPTTAFELEPRPDTDSLTYFEQLLLKGSYRDEGGAGIRRAFISVCNDSGDNVHSSPLVLDAEDSLCSHIITLVPGTNLIMLYAEDKAGNADSTLTTVRYVEPKATEMVDRTGGTVRSPDGAAVVVPENALLSAQQITITVVDPLDQPKPLDSDLQLLYVAHDFGPDGLRFRKPVTLTLAYTEADLDKDQDGVRDVEPTRLTVVFWDGGAWRRVGAAAVDTAARTVSVSVNHFTIYDLAVDNAEKPQSFKACWSHNPVRSDHGSEFVYELPEDGSVSLYIVDMAGDVVYRFAGLDGTAGVHSGEVKWYGDNVAGRFAGVGLYIYVFRYTNSVANSTVLIRKPVGLVR